MANHERCERCGEPVPADAPEGICPGCLLRAGMDESGTGSPTGFTPLTPEELGRLIPHLEVGEILGQGGMGVVYRARQASLDREVALKVLPPHVAADPAFAERFHREAKAMAKLTHPNIVSVYEAGEVDGTYYLAMELVEGVNLRQAQSAGRLAPAEALGIVPQICDALQYAHDQGIVHRDVKPENILLDKQGRVKITDFGLAKLVGGGGLADAALTGTDQVMGTYHYMAPEQMEMPQEVDHRADIYSLGVVFYELLTGELPMGKFLPPSQKAKVDAAVDVVVLRALERERERRYQRADEVRTGVEMARESKSSPVSDKTPEPILPPPPRAAEPRPVETRTSKFAVLSCLMTPLAILAAIALGGILDSPEAGSYCFLTAAGLTIVGMILSVVALIRVAARPDLTGAGYAVTGIVVPGLLMLLAVPFLLMASGDHMVVSETGGVSLGPVGPSGRVSMQTALREDLMPRLLELSGGMTSVDDLAKLVDPDQRAWFRSLSSVEHRRLYEESRLGLPMLDVNGLAAPLSEWEIRASTVSGNTGTATLVHGDRAIRFPMTYNKGRWYFAIGPIEQFRWVR